MMRIQDCDDYQRDPTSNNDKTARKEQKETKRNFKRVGFLDEQVASNYPEDHEKVSARTTAAPPTWSASTDSHPPSGPPLLPALLFIVMARLLRCRPGRSWSSSSSFNFKVQGRRVGELPCDEDTATHQILSSLACMLSSLGTLGLLT